jgi:ATP-dependent RNA helicase DDX23/PRP28
MKRGRQEESGRADADTGAQKVAAPTFATEEEELEAARLKRIAERAEMRAMERAAASRGGAANAKGGEGGEKVVFKTKKQREIEALAKLQEERRASELEAKQGKHNSNGGHAPRGDGLGGGRGSAGMLPPRQRNRDKEYELEEIRRQYLGGRADKRRLVKPSEKFKQVFKFEWDATDDTSTDKNPLYAERAQINAMYGRGYIAGIDMREQRKSSAFISALVKKRQEEQRRLEQAQGLSEQARQEREKQRAQELRQIEAAAREEERSAASESAGASGRGAGGHWSEKPLSAMKERDWRIFREDFDIRVKGGKAPLPLRNWSEGQLPDTVIRAIDELGYKDPSPIQRQAIPIGLQFRDLIGIAETGSGKTAAFCIPMICYIMSLPQERRRSVADDGPLAVIMAPTRELAQQIDEECCKFSKHTGLLTACVVGGQDIEAQGFTLRQGVEIVIGTPGRLNDCLEKHYLVLNQASYVVLDEADRMIDMGFEEQVLAVLDGMGGLLKSEDEATAWEQEEEAKSGKSLFRVTSMFSATMPPEVERMAQRYLRHPAIVQIGDEDSGKNKRIKQVVQFMTEGAKKNSLMERLRSFGQEDKGIIFVNTKKTADILGRQLEQSGFLTGVLHGGKTQDQREANLEDFRAGEIILLVATDVASRGLDIPDVSFVLNYEMPNKIETYSHRIGRTGRAGKEGLACTFITESDSDLFYDLKQYLISTDNEVPQQLSKHAASQAPPGTRRDDGKLVNSERQSVKYAKN